MGVTKNKGRQGQLIAECIIAKADLVTAVAAAVIDMPSGAVVDEVFLVVDELFDPTTSAVIEVGSSATTTNDLVASQNIFTGQALGGRAGATTGKGTKFVGHGAIYAKYTSGGGLATAGKLRIICKYHLSNDADFVQM